jgi:hypothetical protein
MKGHEHRVRGRRCRRFLGERPFGRQIEPVGGVAPLDCIHGFEHRDLQDRHLSPVDTGVDLLLDCDRFRRGVPVGDHIGAYRGDEHHRGKCDRQRSCQQLPQG